MYCEAFEKIVVDIARELALDETAKQSGLHHARSCVRCAGRLKTEQGLSRGLHAVAKSDQLLSAPPALEASLLAAFRQRDEAATVAATVIVPTFRESALQRFFAQFKWDFAPVAAFTVIVLITIAASRVMTPTSTTQKELTLATPSPATVDTPSTQEQVKAPMPQFEPEPQRIAVEKSPTSRQPLQVKANPMRPQPLRRGDRVTVDVGPFQLDEPEIVSAKDFIVFDYARNLPPADSVQLMRVRMPRERLEPLGIPLPENTRNENFVNADFLVGSDGVPRAIRVANR